MIFCSWLHHLLGLDGEELCANQCVHSVLCTTVRTFLQERFQEAKIHPSTMFLAPGQTWNFTQVFLQAVTCSVAQSCLTLCDPMDCSMPDFPVLHLPELLRLMSTEMVMPFNHLMLCCPLLCFQSFPESGSFLMSWFFTSGGQNIRASASVLPINIRVDFL